MSISKLDLPPKGGVVGVEGAQWGDEAKGKIVDWLAEKWSDVIVRGTGGANAGHTICVGGKSHIFHLMLSGILSGKPCYIGNGVAFDPKIMLDEIEKLKQQGVSAGNLKIAFNARLVIPLHIILDRVRESSVQDGKIGTTGRGIGPCYEAQTGRLGLRVVDLLNQDQFREKLKRYIKAHRAELDRSAVTVQEVMQEDGFLKQFCKDGCIDIDAICRCYFELGNRLRSYITDTDALVRKAVADGENVLMEGAQGYLLAVDDGIYPKVTTSDSTGAGLAKGCGLSESQVTHTFAAVKAPYMTRVGNGAFPTEFGPAADDDFPDADINSSNPVEQCVAIRKAGNEYGGTTGRDRRCGRLDMVLLRHSLKSGRAALVLTKVDVMDKCREIKICTHYIYCGLDRDFGSWVLRDGDEVYDLPLGDDDLLDDMEPQYKTFRGWMTDTPAMRSADELPAELVKIIRFIEDAVGCKVAVVSVGPDREQTIVLNLIQH